MKPIFCLIVYLLENKKIGVIHNPVEDMNFIVTVIHIEVFFFMAAMSEKLLYNWG